MPNAATRPDGWFGPALAVVAIVTVYRIALLAFNSTDLFVDEAQYWFWGQNLAFGYYSKPPLIGWVIRAFTEIAGSDSVFWVRLPGTLFHAATALILAAITAPENGRRVAVFVAAAYVTLPMVTVGSFLISTDTIMFPFLSIGLLCWLRVLNGAPWPWAALAGAMIGLGFMAKYAAIYFLIGAVLAAMVMPTARPGWKNAGLALVAFALVIAPNLLWNLFNGAPTVEHTLDNADWVRDPGTRANLNFAGLAEFFGSQFIVFGPVFMGALLWLWVRKGGLFLWFSLPIVLLVCGQALLSQAYANWAAAAYLAGTLIVVPWLAMHHVRWLIASLVLHGTFALALPLGAVFAAGASEGSLLHRIYGRYLGHTAFSQALLDAADAEGAAAIVADNRDILADLFHTGRDIDLPIFARPRPGRPRNHYEMRHGLKGEIGGTILFVGRRPPRNCPATEVALPEGTPQKSTTAYLVPGDCWAAD